MTFFTFKDTLFLALCLLLPVSILLAQKPVTPTVKTAHPFCGTLHPQWGHDDVKPVKPTVRGEEDVYSDRFGNYYSADDLMIPKGSSVGQGGTVRLQTGYFNPIYHEVPNEVQTLINKVLLEVSNEIVQRQGIDACSQNYRLNLDILWGDFGTATEEIWVENNITNLPPPTSGVLGIGSPFYEQTISSQCLGLAADRPFSKINGGWILRPNRLDGRILLNSNLEDYTSTQPDGNYSYWLNETDTPNRPNSFEFDLHTIFLHELLHVLGIASRIDPDLTGSSRYDLQLRVQDIAGDNSPLLIPDPATPGCYTGHPEINDFLFNDCDDDRSIGFRASDEIAMQNGTYSVAEAGNAFSHFINVCGNEASYLMLPGLNPGQAIREVSSEELAILCDMGYQTSSNECENCFVLGWSNTNSRVAEYDPCSFLPDICAGVPTTFSLSQLTRLQTNSDDIEWGTPFFNIQTGDDLEDSTIDFEINGDELTITVSPNSQGDLHVRFPIIACDDGHITVLTHAFLVSAVCNECISSQDVDCGNISCSTDFEEYPNTNAFISFGEVMRFPGNSFISIPRLSHSLNPIGNHLFAPTRTPVTLALNNPVLPGCKVTIGLDAVLAGTSGELDFWGSEIRMCSASEVTVGVPSDCMDAGTDCGDGVFVPQCLGQTGAIATGGPMFDEDLVFETPPPFENYSFTFTNESDDNLNFIYLFAPIRGCWIDNIEITTHCPVDLTTTVNAPVSFCSGDIQSITFEICNNSSEATTISGEVEDVAGWVFFDTFEDIEVTANGGCATVTIPTRPTSGITSGSYDFNLTMSAINQCGLTNGIIESFSLNVDNPTPIISTTGDIPESFCNGTTQPITFKVCNDGEDPMAVFPLVAETIPGWDFTVSVPITSLESGECVNFTYQATPNLSTSEGDYEFILEIRAQNECGRTEEIYFPYTLSTEQCTQQFDCTAASAFLVGQTNCNRRISDLASSLSLPPQCPFPDEAVSWPANSLSDATVIVEDELIIDRNYTFNNCEFIMRPNSRITVSDGQFLRIRGSSPGQSWLHGCTALWEGIKVNGTGRVIIETTRIQDATEAIDLRGAARLALTSSELVNNGTGVYLEGDKVGVNVQIDAFFGNLFTRENDLMPYTGSDGFTPASIGVHTNENFIANTFGIQPTTAPLSAQWLSQRNIYRNLETGILATTNDPITVLHSLFEDTSPGAFSVGINLFKSNLVLRGMGQDHVSFRNLNSGIRATGNHHIDAVNNLVVNCNTGFASVGNGRVDINDNSFTDVGSYAIFYNNQEIQFTNDMGISGNTILLNGTNFARGIDITHQRKRKGATVIEQNNITLSGPGVGVGLTGNKMSLYENNITINTATANTTGIEFRQGQRNTASYNRITGPGSNSNATGITVGTDGPANPYLKCNLFNNLADGLMVLRTGTGLQILFNEFAGDMRAGIFFAPTHTSFLRHTNSRNQWTGNFEVGALVSGLAANTPNPATILDNQRWTIASNLFPPSVTVLNFPALANSWAVTGPSANFTPCAPALEGLTIAPNGKTGKSLTSSIAKRVSTSDLKISPNPSLLSQVTVQTPALANEANLTIMDIYGRALRSIEIPAGPAGAGVITLELPEKGVYFVVLREAGNGKAPVVKRVIRN